MKKFLKFTIVLSIIFAMLSGNVAVLAADIVKAANGGQKTTMSTKGAEAQQSSEPKSEDSQPSSEPKVEPSKEPETTPSAEPSEKPKDSSSKTKASSKSTKSSTGENADTSKDADSTPSPSTMSLESPGTKVASAPNTGEVSVVLDLGFPNVSPDKLQSKLSVELKNSETDAVAQTKERPASEKKDRKLYYAYGDLTPGKYTLTISGAGYKTYTQSDIQVEADKVKELKLTNKYDKALDKGTPIKGLGIIAIGDINKDGTIDDDDENEMLTHIKEGAHYEEKFDLNGDNEVNIIDLSYISSNKQGNYTYTGNGIASPVALNLLKYSDDALTIDANTTNGGTGELTDILENNDKYVSLGHSDPEKEISEAEPVQIELKLDENTAGTEMITIAPPEDVQNRIETGEAIVEGTKDGKEVKIHIPIGKETSTEVATINQEPGELGEVVLGKFADNEMMLTDAATVEDIDLDVVQPNPSGMIELNLQGQIAVKKVTIKVTGTKSKKLADIAKVEFLNDMDSKIPEPTLNEPKNVQVKQIGEEKIEITWDSAVNVTGYVVQLEGVVDGKEVKETTEHAVEGNMLTLEFFNGKGIKDLKLGDSITASVCSTSGTWRSPFTKAKPHQITSFTTPAKVDYINAVGGYTQIDVSWTSKGRAEWFDVYYREYNTGEYIRATKDKELGKDATSYKIVNLPPEVKQYQIYVIPSNAYGESTEAPIIATATTTTSQPTVLPKYKTINKPQTDETGKEIEGKLTQGLKNVTWLFGNGKMCDSPLDAGTPNKRPWSALGVADNSYSSYLYVNDWSDGTSHNDFTGRGVVYEFNEEQEIGFITIAQIENKAYLNDAEFLYEDANGNMTTVKTDCYNVQTRTDVNGREYSYVRLREPIKTKKLQMFIARYGNGMSIAEVRFHKYAGVEKEIDDLFADEQMHLVLKDDVTEDKLNEIQDHLNTPDPESNELHPDKDVLQKELDDAKKLLADKNSLRQPMKIDTSMTVANDGSCGFSSGLNAWQPLGIVGYAGDQTMNIYVGNPAKKVGDTTNLKLRVTQYHAEAANWKSSQDITLKVGANPITVPQANGFSHDVELGGSLYIEYTGKDPNEEYKVRVVGGSDIPVLDLTKKKDGSKYKDENEKLEAVKTYVGQLETLVPNLKKTHDEDEFHKEKVKNRTYDQENDEDGSKAKEECATSCLLGATEIVLDKMMYSVCADEIYKGLSDYEGTDAKAQKLYESCKAMDQMIDLFYSHKGLSKDPAAGPKNQYPVARFNIRYHIMFAGAAMYAGGLHIGIPKGDVSTLSKGTPINADENGKYISGNYFGWGISHEIGHIINESAYVHGEVTNNYYSVLSQADDTNKSVRFEYPEVYKKVTSGKKGKSQNVFTQLGLYWQLHLAFDKGGYNYKTFDSYKEQKENLIVARMDSYARDPESAPKAASNGIALTLVDSKDDNLMRLACAATQSNILEFFIKWGMDPNPETIAYANQWDKDETAYWYINDEARAYQLANGIDKAKEKGMSSGTQVNANLELKGDDSNKNSVEIKMSNTNTNNGAMLGYEIIRSYWEDDEIVSKPVAFVTVGDALKDGQPDNTEITYTDKVETINNRVFTYKVVAYDKYLGKTSEVTLPAVKISHDGTIGEKEDWEISTNMVEGDEENITLPDDYKCEPEKETNVSKIADNYKERYKQLYPEDEKYKDYKEEDYVATKPKDEDGEIVISLPKANRLVGLKYTSLSGKELQNYEIQVKSQDAENKDEWITVKKQTTNILQKVGNKIANIFSASEPKTETIDFTKEGDDSQILYDYLTSEVRLVIKDSDIAISEIELIGQTGDNVEFGVESQGITADKAIGKLSADFTYDKKGQKIPANSIVFVGSYKGNPAYNVLKLWHQNGGTKKYGLVGGDQIILAPNPGKGNLGEIKEGIWIYWVEPTTEDGKENPVYKQLEQDLNKGVVRTELYRVDDAMEMTNERLVSDTLERTLPSELPQISLTGIDIPE